MRIFYKILVLCIVFISSIALPVSIQASIHSYDYCKVAGCLNKAVYESKYCSDHVCKMAGCADRGDYKGYCFKHKSWAPKKNKTPDSSSKQCMVNGCTMYRGRGYNYCIMHTCSKSLCHNQRISGSVYCKEHAKNK